MVLQMAQSASNGTTAQTEEPQNQKMDFKAFHESINTHSLIVYTSTYVVVPTLVTYACC